VRVRVRVRVCDVHYGVNMASCSSVYRLDCTGISEDRLTKHSRQTEEDGRNTRNRPKLR